MTSSLGPDEVELVYSEGHVHPRARTLAHRSEQQQQRRHADIHPSRLNVSNELEATHPQALIAPTTTRGRSVPSTRRQQSFQFNWNTLFTIGQKLKVQHLDKALFWTNLPERYHSPSSTSTSLPSVHKIQKNRHELTLPIWRVPAELSRWGRIMCVSGILSACFRGPPQCVFEGLHSIFWSY